MEMYHQPVERLVIMNTLWSRPFLISRSLIQILGSKIDSAERPEEGVTLAMYEWSELYQVFSDFFFIAIG